MYHYSVTSKRFPIPQKAKDEVPKARAVDDLAILSGDLYYS
jgi:hypothetical protein